MPPHLDWSAFENTDPFGFSPASGTPSSPDAGYAAAAGLCNGQQRCLAGHNEVMCPSYRVTGEARHSPYHRAQAIRAALAATPGDGSCFESEALRSALELCIGCKGCKRECPNGVDIALLATEARARTRATTPDVSRRDRLFAGLPDLVFYARRLRVFIHLANIMPGIGRLARRLLRIAPRRPLPVPAANSFHDTHPLGAYGTGERGDVVLLADTFSNHFEPTIAKAALDLLTGLGYRVHLPRRSSQGQPLCCGRTYLSQGRIEEAKHRATALLNTLSPFAEAGIPIIGLEPSCLLMLRDEYRALGLGSKVTTLARNALMLEEFLVRLVDETPGALPLRPMPDRQILVHGHCHQKAFGTLAAVERLLGMIPGVFVTPIKAGCCGMAGAFGYEAEHDALSMRMAEDQLLPAVRNAPTGALIVANGTSCRQQIEHGTGRRSLHLAQVLLMQLEVTAQA